MSLSEELALMCVAAQTRLQKQAAEPPADPRELRNQFESLTLREEALRRHAKRLQDLATSRAEEEDTTPSGYLRTGLERTLVPMPHTTGEGLLRGLGGVAGGIAGYRYGKARERLDPEAVKAIFAPPGVALNELENTPIGKRLELLPNSLLSKDVLLRGLSEASGEETANTLQEKRWPWQHRTKTLKNQDIVNKTVRGGVGHLREEVANLARQGSKKGPVTETLSNLRRGRTGGAIGGALLGTAAVGLPFALRALLQKGQGGEAAVRARGRAEEAGEQAEQAATGREKIVGQVRKSLAPSEESTK
jgi:hypothetical protein